MTQDKRQKRQKTTKSNNKAIYAQKYKERTLKLCYVKIVPDITPRKSERKLNIYVCTITTLL